MAGRSRPPAISLATAAAQETVREWLGKIGVKIL